MVVSTAAGVAGVAMVVTKGGAANGQRRRCVGFVQRRGLEKKHAREPREKRQSFNSFIFNCI